MTDMIAKERESGQEGETQPKMINMNRRGKILVHEYLLRNRPDLLMLIQSKFVIVRADYIYEQDCFLYHGVGDVFDEIRPGMETPSYAVRIEELSADNSINVVFTRQ